MAVLHLPADLAAGSVVVAAVSGGADSVALLDLLLADGRFRVVCWHLDHQLRDDSAADARWVVGLCARLGVACVTAVADVRAAVRGDGIEEAARRVRYAMLGEACRSLGATAACTAHHRDDQAETALMQILRGCGPEGPSGIAPERPLAAGVRLLRPLLGETRAGLVAHCRARGLDWREDASNADQRFRRNHIRLAVLPEWERHCPGIGAELAAAAHAGRRVRSQAESDAAGLWEGADLDVAALRRLSPVARAACWRLLLGRLGIDADRERIRRLDDLLAGAPGRRLRLGAWLLLRRGRRIVWSPA